MVIPAAAWNGFITYIFKVAISSPKTYEDQYMNSLFY